jgi:hypothetical protein
MSFGSSTVRMSLTLCRQIVYATGSRTTVRSTVVGFDTFRGWICLFKVVKFTIKQLTMVRNQKYFSGCHCDKKLQD